MDAMKESILRALIRRQETDGDVEKEVQEKLDAGAQILALLSNPFAKQLQVGAVYSALATSLVFTAITAVLFSALRPYNQVVYAPKLKHADDKHAPPPVGSGYFAWVKPLWTTREEDLVHYVGLDATLFLRFTRMCRNIFLALSLLYCSVMLPINLTKNIWYESQTWLDRVTPMNVYDGGIWALVVVTWLANITICFFLWWNYRKVVGLRRKYFESGEYQKSLHARSLMITEVPTPKCNDEGLASIIDEVAPSASFARTTIARNVKHLPTLLTEYEMSVRKLEKVLSKYLRKPDNLPATRPMFTPPKKDPDFANGAKVDAIEYWNRRVTRLRIEIVDARKSVDRRNAYPYGFASFPDISEAHAVAYVSRKKHPAGATILLAPRPTDIIWENMHLTSASRRTRRWMMTMWISLLTLLWIGPNAMLAIFIVNLGNLGAIWPTFQQQLSANPAFWSIVQGVASPAITSAFYLVLPVIFRRLQIRAGDRTKTGRERHVMTKLYAFFIFNNLFVFSLFSSMWSFISAVVTDTGNGKDAWNAIVKADLPGSVFVALCTVSPFWVTWLLQRQLGAAIDLSQLWKLLYSFIVRRVSHPTPREIIELTAPPHFEYAMYYNYFLFYATVAICFAGLQPLVVPSAALYFALDVGLKKYLIMYIFVTKTESGGLFWRPMFNRFIFGTILANLVVFLTAWVRGNLVTHVQAIAIAPLPFLVFAFKIVCGRMYDDKLYYYSQHLRGQQHPPKDGLSKNDKLAARFGHPVLYKALFKPMVHKKAQHRLHEVLKTKPDDFQTAFTGYADSVVKMDNMVPGDAGKSDDASTLRNFEMVGEGNLDFEYFKNRAEFAEDHGGGEIFGRSGEIMRPGTPSSMFTSEFGSRPGTPVGGQSVSGVGGVIPPRSYSPTNSVRSYSQAPPGMAGASGLASPYGPAGYGPQTPGYAPPSASYAPPSPGYPPQSVGFTPAPMDRGRHPLYNNSNESQGSLVPNAASIGGAGSRSASPAPPPGGPGGYGPVPQGDDGGQEHDPMSYDYYRAPRARRYP